MKPRGPLMIEHRLIEKMLRLAGRELESIKTKRIVDPVFIDTLVDFIKVYADRTHHGKEEDILFKALAAKNLSEKDKKAMQDLVEDHIIARKAVKELVAAKSRYIGGDPSSIDVIVDKLGFLISFYPVHIKKEDDIFFPDTEGYFSQKELDNLLGDFWEFDRRMIHEKYTALYETLSKK